jgi:phospholipid/cholesterol/gamma-HCH transport system substrate-binding protein
MNTSASQKLKIGIFTIAGILVLIAGVFLIGSKKNMFSKTYKLYGKFKNTGGLQVGNNIRFGGVNIGTVERITIVTDTVVQVDMIVETKMREFLKVDAVASVGSDGLMGDKILSIAPGSPGAPPIEAGGQIKTIEPLDIAGVMTQFTHVAANAEIITGALANMSLEIKNGNGSISRLLYKDDLAKGLEGTLNNTRDLTGAMQGIATQIKSGKGSIGSLLYTDTLSASLNRTVNKATDALATVQVAADNFSENMKALQGNYFLKGYFKKKAKAQSDSLKTSAQNEIDDLDEQDLEQIKADAEKALQQKRANKAKSMPSTISR